MLLKIPKGDHMMVQLVKHLENKPVSLNQILRAHGRGRHQLLKVKDKEKLLKVARENWVNWEM